jgi:mannose-6-phosphate isomerase-like protein (cupin superfamily)
MIGRARLAAPFRKPGRRNTMTAYRVPVLAKGLGIICVLVASLAAQQSTQPPPLAQRITHTDPAKYRPQKSVHQGAGPMAYMGLMDQNSLDANLFFLHRGVIEPKGGIGEHFHNTVEEMFVILSGEAQFTIDGHTSVVKAPAGALCRLGHAHAIYNHTDKPIEWMNINVSSFKSVYDAFDLGDPRVGVPVDPIPQFMTMRLDRNLLKPIDAATGAEGDVKYRRALAPTVFAGPWAYVDQYLIAPGASTGSLPHKDISEAYYVLAGSGTVSVATQGHAGETAQIKTGDAIPVFMGESSSFENTGSEPLELMVIGVARDMDAKAELIKAGARR